MFERFTERARQAVVLAQEEARTLKHDHIASEHLLLGLMREEQGIAAQVLALLDVSVDRARVQVVRIVGYGQEFTLGEIPFTSQARKVLERAQREAASLGHRYIGTEHLLLGLVRADEGVALRVLLDFGAGPEQVFNEVLRMLSGPGGRRLAAGHLPPRAGGWLDGLSDLLGPLGEAIKNDLGRAPDVGDLLMVLTADSSTLVSRALAEFGVDLDALWATVERLRNERSDADAHLADQIAQVGVAKEQAIEEKQFELAAQLRDQERQLTEQQRACDVVPFNAVAAVRRRLGIPAARASQSDT
jgi:ATP-dependent Clp protease ATP-binding subunit ClpA